MRALPLLLLLAGAPALAQQGPVDPDLVGTWTLDFVERVDSGVDVKMESMTLTFTADGGLVAKATMVRDGERRTETETETFTTENGQILAGPSPVDYVLLGPDDLRISDTNLSLRFRRVSP